QRRRAVPAKTSLGIPRRLAVSNEIQVGGWRHTLRRDGLGLEFFGLVMGAKRVDKFVELAFEYEVQLMNRHADPMVGDAIFLEIVCAYLFRTVARADH